MHEKARQRYFRNIAGATTPEGRDSHLDRYIDAWMRVTEWDAGQWGFDPDRWMEAERVELAGRGGTDWPVEVI